MRTLLAALTILLAAGAAAAAEGPYAVMSLVGDGLLVVRHRPMTGTSLSANVREFAPFAGPALDRAALLAADAGLRRAVPEAKVLLLGGRDPSAIEAQSRTLGAPGAAQAVADALLPHLPATGAARLVLVLKGRGAGRMRVDEGVAEAGLLEGLGYYVDTTLITHRETEYAMASRGFLAPFAYVDLALVDLATGKVVAEREVRAASPHAATGADTVDPWEGLSPEQKIRDLQALLAKDLADAVPALLGRR